MTTLLKEPVRMQAALRHAAEICRQKYADPVWHPAMRNAAFGCACDIEREAGER